MSIGARVGDLPRLQGEPVDAAWDQALGPTMTRRGRIVHEELVLDTLLGDLREPGPT